MVGVLLVQQRDHVWKLGTGMNIILPDFQRILPVKHHYPLLLVPSTHTHVCILVLGKLGFQISDT